MEHPLVQAARTIGAELLRPNAESVDVAGVPRSHIDALAAAGLMDIVEDRPVARAITEELAAADTSTWFVWTQHYTPMRTLMRGDGVAVRERWLPDLLTGRALAGVAFTHLRRPGPPDVVATRVGNNGWSISGRLAWLTSWDLADTFLVGAQSGDDVVWACVPLRGRDGVQATPLELAAMGGTSTVGVMLDDLRVSDDEVALVEPLAQWRADDAEKTLDVSPAVFGVTREAIDRLGMATPLRTELDNLRVAAYTAEDPAERLQLRVAAHLLCLQATSALVAAGGGRAMLRSAAPQRLARVAMFLLVQGQDARAREAQIAALSGLR